MNLLATWVVNYYASLFSHPTDQWSPINVEGKKQYDREFLMQLQGDPQSMMKLINLPNMDIIRDRANDKVKIPASHSDFMPSYVKTTQSKVRYSISR